MDCAIQSQWNSGIYKQMPELEVYQDDIQKRSDDYCRRLIALGRRGLQETGL